MLRKRHWPKGLHWFLGIMEFKKQNALSFLVLILALYSNPLLLEEFVKRKSSGIYNTSFIYVFNQMSLIYRKSVVFCLDIFRCTFSIVLSNYICACSFKYILLCLTFFRLL